MRCEYCGAGLIISQDGLRLLPRKQAACPKCQSVIADDAWFCPSCGEVIAKDLEHLKLVKRRIAVIQEQAREKLPEIQDKIEPTEYIYYLIPSDGRRCGCTVVTDKKLANNFKNKYWETSLSDLINVSNPYDSWGLIYMDVQTIGEKITIQLGLNDGWHLRNALDRAFSDWVAQRKNIESLLWLLKLPDKNPH
jgi:hypothetical protein